MLKYSNIFVRFIRHLSKPAAESKLQGGSERRTGVYTQVYEDSSTESTKQFASAVGFGKMSILIILSNFLLAGCWTNAITGASLIYDRHNIYIKLNDYQLAGKINKELYKDKLLKCDECALEVAVFNRDVLMTGSLPSKNLRHEASTRVKSIAGSRRIFNQVAISLNKGDSLYDSWITGNIRGKILADSDIDPHDFKVVTSRQIVYLLGDVHKEQAEKVLSFAQESPGVYRVVNLLRYYNFIRKQPRYQNNSRL